MTSTSHEHGSKGQWADMLPGDGNRVVISGMAGNYPQAKNVEELKHILYNKINPVSSGKLRWENNHPEVTQHIGLVADLDLFDAQFFKVHYRQGHKMDPLGRKLLETAYEALYDAGISPNQLNGKKVGVFVGTSLSESEKMAFYVSGGRTGLGLTGCCKTMFANRISYWLNAKGPSLNIDEACCSSMAALEQAYQAIERGECESAIVGGANLCLHPQSAVHYGRVLALAADGKTRSFDKNATGTVLSEAINVLFLQKAKDALRAYADVMYVKCEFSAKLNEGDAVITHGFTRSAVELTNFLKDFYNNAGIPPSLVEYVEAFGAERELHKCNLGVLPDIVEYLIEESRGKTGIDGLRMSIADLDTDKAELEAFDKIFCKDREGRLLVGSVMSNIGYSGPASGISAVTKVLLGFHKRELAGNLHCETPRSDVMGIQEGRISIVNDAQRLRSTYAAVNSLSVTGVTGHVLLRGNTKPKDIHRYKANIPFLINISSREESGVMRIFNELTSHPIDPEQLALLSNIHENRITGHLVRGYIVVDDNNVNDMPVKLSENVTYFDDSDRPLWFVYSGMGSQWVGMGAQLMRMPIFAAAIERCRRVLEPKGIDIVHIITSKDKTIFDNILHSFVGIAAMQIGLTDILKELGLVPDKIIGHSVGELGCAYADGCFTAEEMILSAYSRGLVSLETSFIHGAMAAVGAGYNQMSKMCPPEIAIACHNSPDSCTISGPAEVLHAFIHELTAKGIFAKEVPCSNIAFHSRYIAGAGTGLLKYLKEIINVPKRRSDRWISTSVPQERWHEPQAVLCSAEYHTNNLLNPVLFEESSKLIPSNAVLVEVAPHGLLQAILKRSLPNTCTNIPLTRRGHPDNALVLLEAIGNLYVKGYNPKVRVLYPTVEFPVSNGTPFLSNMVEWAHVEKWNLSLYAAANRKKAAACEFLISVPDDEYSYLKDHVIRNKTLLPFSFALVAAWDTLAMSMNLEKKSTNVKFHDIQFYSQPILHDHKNNRLRVSLQKGSGHFEIMDGISRVATGFIDHFKFDENRAHPEEFTSKEYQRKFEISKEDLYELFEERDYSYSGEFRSIESANAALTEANLEWKNNWVTFIDGMIQLSALKHHHNSVSQPDQIGLVTINVAAHQFHSVNENYTSSELRACVNDEQNYIKCGGVVIENIKFKDLSPATEDHVSLKTLKFVPRFHSNIDVTSALQVIFQIVGENVGKIIINVIGVTEGVESRLFKEIENIENENNSPGVQIHFRQLNKNIEASLVEADLVVVQNLSNDDEVSQVLYQTLKNDTFIINEEFLDSKLRIRPSALYSTVSILKVTDLNICLELARWRPNSKITAKSTSTITIQSESELPFLTLARNNLAHEGCLVVLASYPPVEGLKDLIKQWRIDSVRNRIHLVMTDEINALEELPPCDLAYNIYTEGVWGGEYYLPSKEKQPENTTLSCEQIGNYNSLKWIPELDLIQNGTVVKVHYAGINVSDVKRAAGAVPFKSECYSDKGFGMEFSGLTKSGERVMGLVPQGAASSHVMARPELLWLVPSHWTLEDAATVPFAYAYAYYCLDFKVAIRLVEKHVTQFSVLVHGGAGALGQAIISIALAKGYKVFTTVSDVKKKRFLLRLFPELREEDIGNSRDTTFGDMIMKATNGKGCNIVLCCLKGQLKNNIWRSGGIQLDVPCIGLPPGAKTSLGCCGSSGTTFDTVLINNKEDYPFGMNYLTNERAYIPVDLSAMFTHLKHEDLQILQTKISDGIALGHVRPLSRVTFAPHEASRAFRLLAASRHRGRVLLRMQDSQPLAQPIISCTEDQSHLILCDEQHLGLQLADMLIHRGANKIHIHIANQHSHLSYRLRVWENFNVQVAVTCKCFVADKDFSDLLPHIVQSGPLYGVYVIADNSWDNSVISKLDLVTRKLCPSLKYFVVLNDDGISGKRTCIKRARDGFPAIMLDLSILKTSYNNNLIWKRKAVEATVLALRSAHPILLAHRQHSIELSLLQQVAALADINIIEKTSDDISLEELGMDPGKSEVVGALLSDKFHISIFEDKIPSLTIKQIKQMDEKYTEAKPQEVNGLGLFYSNLDTDELMATSEMVFLLTLINNASMRDDEYDLSESFLCIIPGLEGNHMRFRTLSERLKIPTFVLQPGLDHPEETLQKLARRYAEVLLKKTRQTENFNLLGYETGVIIALEVAAILEEHGKTGTVFCIGDGPKEIKALLEAVVLAFGSEEALQAGVVRHMSALMGHGSATPAEVSWSSWSARADACVRSLLGHMPHSAQYARALLEAAYVRIGITRQYNAHPQALRSRLVLLRTQTEPHSREEEDCSLQHYSTQPIVVANLASPLSHATYDLRVPAIINRYLGEEILKAFEKKNICESYLLDADKFLCA